MYGLQTMEGRVPTFLLNVDGVEAATVATTMAERGYGVWAHDSWYSLGLREKLPYPKDAVRVGFIHYNTVDEVDGFVAELASLAGLTGKPVSPWPPSFANGSVSLLRGTSSAPRRRAKASRRRGWATARRRRCCRR